MCLANSVRFLTGVSGDVGLQMGSSGCIRSHVLLPDRAQLWVDTLVLRPLKNWLSQLQYQVERFAEVIVQAPAFSAADLRALLQQRWQRPRPRQSGLPYQEVAVTAAKLYIEEISVP